MLTLFFLTSCENYNTYIYSAEYIEKHTKELQTELPVVIIKTHNCKPVSSKYDWKRNAEIIIVNSDNSIDYKGTLSIKGRGNTTWEFPKKPYDLKLDAKSEILGMREHRGWCLLANWMDRTLIRNAVAFEIARITELEWTPNGKHVEVILNGEHIGNYYLCEDIDVDVSDKFNDGYIFELDLSYDRIKRFRPARSLLPWNIKDPYDVNDNQFQYIVKYVNDMEETLYDETKFENREFTEYMDLESYIDWWIVNELTMNRELCYPKSCYMHKCTNGKMKAGPVWDYDWGTFTPKTATIYCGKDQLYYQHLFHDTEFITLLKSRWMSYKHDFEIKIPSVIDSLENTLSKSDSVNIQMWPITGTKPNGDEDLSFSKAVQRLKSTYLSRIAWLDNMIQSM